MSQTLTAAVILAGILGFLYILWKPRWAVLIVLIMFPLEQLLQSYIPALSHTGWLTQLGIAILAGFAVMSRLLKGDNLLSGFFNPVSVLMFVMYLWIWAATTWSPSESVRMVLLLNVPYVVLLLICVPLLLDDVADLQRIAMGVLVVGSIMALLIFLNPNAGYRVGRLQLDVGTFTGMSRTNPLALATTGGMMSLMAVLLQFNRRSMWLDLMRVTAFFLGLGLAIGSGSRGQVLAAVMVGVLFYPVARPMENIKGFFVTTLGLGVVGLALFATFSFFISDVNVARWDTGNMALDMMGRFDMVMDLFMVYLSEPAYWIQGLGSNAFSAVSAFQGSYVHNSLTEILCELGVIGAFLMAFLMLKSWQMGKWLWGIYRYDRARRSTVAILGAMWLYTLLLSLKQGSFVLNQAAFVWWLVLARIAAHEAMVQMSQPDEVWDYDELEGEEEDEYAWAG